MAPTVALLQPTSAGFTDQVARDVTSRLVPSLKWALATNCWLPPTPGMVAGFGVRVTLATETAIGQWTLTESQRVRLERLAEMDI